MTKLRKGDLFQFNLADGSVFGQIIVTGDVIYVVIFEELQYDSERDNNIPNTITEHSLCGWTLDGRIYHGMWKIVGNAPLPNNFPRPCYKVEYEGLIWIESFEGDLKRPASDEESRLLDFRTTVAPIRFENALAARYDLQEWDESFKKLSVGYARERELEL